MIKFIFFITVALLFSGCKKTEEDLITNWTEFSPSSIGYPYLAFKKVSANDTHVFVGCESAEYNENRATIIILDTANNLKIIKDFSGPSQDKSASEGFSGSIRALTAFASGAWVALQEKNSAVNKSLVAQIDNLGRFYSAHQSQDLEVIKLIALPTGILTLEYRGLNTPKFYAGDATKLSETAIDWKKFTAFKLTATAMGDAAINMLLDNKARPPLLLALSADGLFKGRIGDTDWQKEWSSNPYANLEIFPGGANAMELYNGKLAVGSFSHIISSNKATGFIFCDFEKDSEENPCEKIENAHAKEYKITAMKTVKDILYLGTSSGLITYKNGVIEPVTINKPAKHVHPTDSIIDIALQGDKLWIVTVNGLASLKI